MRQSLLGAVLGAGLVIAMTAGTEFLRASRWTTVELVAVRRKRSELITHVTRGRRTGADRDGDRSATAGDGGLPRGPRDGQDHAHEHPQFHLGPADD